MKPHSMIFAGLSTALAFISSAAIADEANIIFPVDSGVIDVTAAPYGAVPDDGQDDTVAIQQALADHPSGNRIFYFPDGTYDISDVLLRRAADDPLRNSRACLELKGSKKRNILQGQSRSGTVLRLMDEVPEDFAGAIINFGPAPAQRFRNALRNMTISIGRAHPQASGVEFNASNQGGVFDGSIQSEDPTHSGAVGLDLRHTDEIGPCLIRHVSIDGFDYGIRSAWQKASQTFEHISLTNQQLVGWQNGYSQAVFARGIHSDNAVTAVANVPLTRGDPGQGKLLLIDSKLVGHDRAAEKPAIRNQKVTYLRNVDTDGYRVSVTRELAGYRGNTTQPSGLIEEYWANGAYDNRRGGPLELFPSPDRMLNLPVREVPDVPWEQDLSRWKGPHQFASGRAGSGSGHPNDEVDDTAAIQAAIDSGATTVYLPNGVWNVHGNLLLRGNVRRLVGCEARMIGPREGEHGVVRIVDGKPDTVVIERLESGKVRYESATQRSVVLANILGGSYRTGTTGSGDLFLADVVFGPCHFERQNVWARQFDIEGDNETDHNVQSKITNDGGTVWILGLKTEDAGTQIRTINGGRTELLGAIHVGASGQQPRFVTVDSSFSAAVVGGGFPVFAQETRDGKTLTAQPSAADVYTAFSADAIRDEEVVIDSEDESGVTLTGEWLERSAFDGGFHNSGIRHDGSRGKGEKSVRYTARLPHNGEYEVHLRWVNPVSGFATAGNVPVTIQHAAGTTGLTVDQRMNGGRWNSIGTFRFDSNRAAVVTLSNEGTQGHVVADAVRFKAVRRTSK